MRRRVWGGGLSCVIIYLMARNKSPAQISKSNTDTLMGAMAIFMSILGALLALGALHRAGVGGNFIFNGLAKSIGILSYVMPVICFGSAYYLWRETLPRVRITTTLGVITVSIATLGLINVAYGSAYSGVLGYIVAAPLVRLFDPLFATLILGGLTASCLMLITNHKPRISALHSWIPRPDMSKLSSSHDNESPSPISVLLYKINPLTYLPFKKRNENINDEEYDMQDDLHGEDRSRSHSEYDDIDYDDTSYSDTDHTSDNKRDIRDELFEGFSEEETNDADDSDIYDNKTFNNEIRLKKNNSRLAKQSDNGHMVAISREILEATYTPPPLDLLAIDSGKSSAGNTNRKMQLMKQTLLNFNIPVEMDGVSVGPTVTRYRVKPAQGVKVNKILTLKDDLQLSLEASSIHIEAPIPGQPFVGIEIPNENKQTLGLGSLLSLPQFTEGSQLMLAIGKDIVGKPIFGDMIKMPHLLVAGATRTGKSVTIQNLLISLLYKNSPHDLKLIILDPKRVEFTAYKGLPHLYAPIVVDPKGAIKALNWLVQEMERRYEILADFGVPNLEDYNNKIFYPEVKVALKKQKGEYIENIPPKMPWIVVVFDEFNDFMLSHNKEITPLITSLTQKGRAAGIHLILATQRPDVKVITGTIKANIPARIALKTTSGMDSRTILDMGGAEDLLGNGDMLYMDPLSSRIARIQAPFVSTEEIQAVIKHVKQAEYDFIPDHIDLSKVNVSSSGTDSNGNEYVNPLEAGGAEPIDNNDYMSAKDYVMATGKASASSLQTGFSWGFPKANKIMMLLERHGVVGPSKNGAKGREVLMKQGEERNEND